MSREGIKTTYEISQFDSGHCLSPPPLLSVGSATPPVPADTGPCLIEIALATPKRGGL